MRVLTTTFAAAVALAAASPAHASVQLVNYAFSGTGTGTMSLNYDTTTSTYSLNALSLTLGSTTFTSVNSTLAINGGSYYCLSALAFNCGAQLGTNTFWMNLDPSLASQNTTVDWSNVGQLVHTFNPITIVQVVGGVPEPATWVMMLLGFAAIGLAVRRAQAVVGESGRLTQ
jgi:PEP-CTERM motif